MYLLGIIEHLVRAVAYRLIPRVYTLTKTPFCVMPVTPMEPSPPLNHPFETFAMCIDVDTVRASFRSYAGHSGFSVFSFHLRLTSHLP